MRKTLLYQWFGLGKIPSDQMSVLDQEGIILMDEGIGGSITFKNFRAPGKRYSWKRNWFTGSLVLTQKSFLAFSFSKPLIGLPLDDPHMNELHCSLKDEQVLCISYDVSIFHEGWSGMIDCCFRTPKAALFWDRLSGHIGL